jgi:hypothetical protein
MNGLLIRSDRQAAGVIGNWPDRALRAERDIPRGGTYKGLGPVIIWQTLGCFGMNCFSAWFRVQTVESVVSYCFTFCACLGSGFGLNFQEKVVEFPEIAFFGVNQKGVQSHLM